MLPALVYIATLTYAIYTPLQSCIPPSDIRLGLAMETHGVSAVRMTPPMPSGLLSKLQTPQIPSQYLVAFFTALPVMAIVITYLATQLQAHLKVINPHTYTACHS